VKRALRPIAKASTSSREPQAWRDQVGAS
jgi:hypothetical protein